MNDINPEDYHLHSWDPFLIEFGDGFGIRWYGLAYVLGFIAGAWLLHRYFKKGVSPLNPEQQTVLFYFLVGGVIVGGRLGFFLFYKPATLLSDPIEVFKITDGGMASHGGFIGVTLALYFAAKKFKMPFLRLGDIVCTLAPAGFLFGRIANYINGELWGKVSDVWWAVRFPGSAPLGTPASQILPRHPSQLYEAALEGLVLLVYVQLRFWKSPKVRSMPGHIAGEFLIAYSILRVIGELFREPDEGIATFLGLNRGAILSIAMSLGGLAIILWSRKKAKKES